MEYELFLKVIEKIKNHGCMAITITGGGEPLMHPNLKEMILATAKYGIDIGLTTNGSRLFLLDESILNKLTWCRVSAGDGLRKNLGFLGISLEEWFSFIDNSINLAPSLDWSLSYVVTKHPDFELIKTIIEFANDRRILYVRLTPDLLDLSNAPEMDSMRCALRTLGLDDSKVVYQERKNSKLGSKKCYISLLKPLIGADGWIYPCCGTQYAQNPPEKDNNKRMRICKAINISNFILTQNPFDGTTCERCYYSQYNNILNMLCLNVKHRSFV